MKPVTFTTQTDLMFDYRGVTHLSSGTAPHHPDQARIVLQNCETTRVDADLDAAVSAAADAGEAELAACIRQHFQPKGRAVESWAAAEL